MYNARPETRWTGRQKVLTDSKSLLNRYIIARLFHSRDHSGQTKSAGVAQLVEQRIRNAKVEGSTPFTGTIFTLTTFFVIPKRNVPILPK
jgi:hypothetical protein